MRLPLDPTALLASLARGRGRALLSAAVTLLLGCGTSSSPLLSDDASADSSSSASDAAPARDDAETATDSSVPRDAGLIDASPSDAAPDRASPDANAGLDASADAGCTPDDSADCAGKCGQLIGHCGSLVTCAGCAAGETCGGGDAGANVCGTGPCTPDCTGAPACGASDGCGGICSNGSCPSFGDDCVNGVCQCNPSFCEGCCGSGLCQTGTTDTACGSNGVACGACAAGTTCNVESQCSACGADGQPCCGGTSCGPYLSCGGGGDQGYCGCTPARPCDELPCGASDGCGHVCQTETCGSGLHCLSGACTCDSTSCTGCCSSGQCLAGNAASACGSTGTSCASCMLPTTCTTSFNVSSCTCPWTKETVSTGGAWISDGVMALDLAGNLQIVDIEQNADGTNGPLVHLQKVSGAWTKTTIAATAGIGGMGLAVDPTTGNLHLVYSGNHYVYASGAWTQPDSYCMPGDDCDEMAANLVIDPSGTLHVAYYTYTPTSATPVRYAKHTSAGWTFETVDAVGPSYDPFDDGISIGLLPGNVPAVAYQAATSANLASRGGANGANGTWTLEQIKTTGSQYASVSMAIDPSNGDVRVVFTNGAIYGYYGVKSAGVWTTTALTGTAGVLPGGPFAGPARIANYTAATNGAMELLTQLPSGAFTPDSVGGTDEGIDALLVQGSGTGGHVWLLAGGYLRENLYSRCALP